MTTSSNTVESPPSPPGDGFEVTKECSKGHTKKCILFPDFFEWNCNTHDYEEIGRLDFINQSFNGDQTVVVTAHDFSDFDIDSAESIILQVSLPLVPIFNFDPFSAKKKIRQKQIQRLYECYNFLSSRTRQQRYVHLLKTLNTEGEIAFADGILHLDGHASDTSGNNCVNIIKANEIGTFGRGTSFYGRVMKESSPGTFWISDTGCKEINRGLLSVFNNPNHRVLKMSDSMDGDLMGSLFNYVIDKNGESGVNSV